MDRTKRLRTEYTNPNQQAFLNIFLGGEKKSYKLYDDFIIGRDMANDIILHDNFVSRRHAAIRHKEGQYSIEDLGSQNGTFVNGIHIHSAHLLEGDKIKIGESIFELSSEIQNTSLDAGLKSKNLNWNEKIQKLPQIAESDQCVLLQGESGTGKEVISRMIHQNSHRRDKAFVSINCSNLNQNLIESELFGHKKGSFTDANTERKGAFLAAQGGTILLDEIGDMPFDLQSKLLRALENREVRPLGADETIKINVRVIAATHKNLPELVAKGLFRMDLFYRLNVIQFHIPALRDRIEDFDTILLQLAKEEQVRIPQSTVNKLKSYDWPGNIRELKNFVLRAKALFPFEEISLDLCRQLVDFRATQSFEEEEKLPPVKRMEKSLIETALQQMRGNQRRAAKSLGMPKSTLHDKIKKYKIELSDYHLGF